MKIFDEKHIKNIVLLGCSKSGKTTLAETMLYEAGLINRRGNVEDHNTVSDYHSIEHERGCSVYSTTMHTEWRNYKINIIDTPGLDDFIGEVNSAVRVADTCVFVINGQHGVEIGTELIWNNVDRFAKPTIFVINQLDHPKADFDHSVASLKEQFGNAAIIMQYPTYGENGFDGIVDLLKMTYYKFPPEGGKPSKLPIPAHEKERAEALHNELVEKAAENDENLMELYFDIGTLDEEHMREGIKIGMRKHELFPIFCLSAKNDMGSGRLMGFIDNVAPSSVDTKPDKTETGEDIPHDINGPAVLFVYKTLMEPNLGKVSFFKVISGQVTLGDELVNHQNNTVERINQLFIIDGHSRNPVTKLVVGDIGATLKLKDTETNHTLRISDFQHGVAPIVFPEPRMFTAIRANNKADDDKLGEVLQKIHQQDPSMTFRFSKELRQLLLGVQGELHLTIIQWMIEHIHGLDIDYFTPRVSYRETIQKMTETSYRHKKQSGGAGQFAEVYMKVEPYEEGMEEPSGFSVRGKEEIDLEWGGKLMFYNCIVGGAIDARFLSSIQKGVMEVMEQGPLTGSYVRDVRVIVYDGKMHSVDSNDIAFKIAGMNAFKQAFLQANPRLLEPIYHLEVLVPEALMGDVMSDLQTRRSIILGIDAKGKNQVISAKTPLSEMDRYISTLRSITQGRASFKTRFAEYAPVPDQLQHDLIATNKEEMMEAAY